MTVIVMLILAGVSLNALVGDNGIITNAQNATLKSSLATLQEYIQQLYVEHYDDYPDNDTSALKKLRDASSTFDSFFYNASSDFNIGDYLFDSEGNVIYVMKISALPKDIKDQVVGGTAGGYADIYDADPTNDEARDNLYNACVNKQDIYGVTSNLTVYYCYDNGTIFGNITSDDLDEVDDTIGALKANSENYEALTGILKDNNFDNDDNGEISLGEIRAVNTLQLTATQLQSLSNLTDFYALTNLKSLYINYSGGTRVEDFDISGLQNCTKLEKVWFYNVTAEDYSYLARVKKLTHLIFYSINDTDLARICGTDNQKKRDK